MDALLTIEDLRECNTPKLLARFPSTDPLRINMNNVIVDFEATLPIFSEENIVLPSSERVAQKKDEDSPVRPVVLKCSDEKPEENTIGINASVDLRQASLQGMRQKLLRQASLDLLWAREMSHVLFHLFNTC